MAHLLEWLLSKRPEMISVDEDMEKRETSNSTGGNVNWDSHYGNGMEVPLKIKNIITYNPTNTILKKYLYPMFIAAYLQ